MSMTQVGGRGELAESLVCASAGVGLMLTGVAGVWHAFAFGSGISLLASAGAFGVVFWLTSR